jgi:hypothetical protein
MPRADSEGVEDSEGEMEERAVDSEVDLEEVQDSGVDSGEGEDSEADSGEGEDSEAAGRRETERERTCQNCTLNH